jgi:5'-3' exonuclease
VSSGAYITRWYITAVSWGLYWRLVDVYLVDGTYELFRHFFALPSHVTAQGREVAATRGVVGSILGMIEAGATHLGVATDHVIESFRNDMWPGYKSSAGVDPLLLQQFPLLEEVLAALGVLVWPMVELEADDALGTAAVVAGASQSVNRALICTPDKDLAQCVVGERIVQLDRRTGRVSDADGVVAKFGVPPTSIPDYLGLVGDSSDGYPGLPGWGAKSAAAVLARYGHFEDIPLDARSWDVVMPGARVDRLLGVLRDNLELALLFRDLATLRLNAPIVATPDDLHWTGPTPAFAGICQQLEMPGWVDRVRRALDWLPPA